MGTYCEATPVTPVVVTSTTPEELCPAGVTNIVYCTAYCPTGATLVGKSCEVLSSSSSTTVLPQGPPTLFDSAFWGAKLRLFFRGPALKFHVKSGINGAPYLRTLTLTLPKGLTFSTKQQRTIAVNGPVVVLSSHSVEFTFRDEPASVLVYLKNHSMVESKKLRKELANGTLTSLTFPVTVTDLAGKATDLTFTVPANS